MKIQHTTKPNLAGKSQEENLTMNRSSNRALIKKMSRKQQELFGGNLNVTLIISSGMRYTTGMQEMTLGFSTQVHRYRLPSPETEPCVRSSSKH